MTHMFPWGSNTTIIVNISEGRHNRKPVDTPTNNLNRKTNSNFFFVIIHIVQLHSFVNTEYYKLQLSISR